AGYNRLVAATTRLTSGCQAGRLPFGGGKRDRGVAGLGLWAVVGARQEGRRRRSARDRHPVRDLSAALRAGTEEAFPELGAGRPGGRDRTDPRWLERGPA